MTAELTIQLLGNTVVKRDQDMLTGFRSQKTLALLAYLAYTAGTSHRREALADLLWDARSTKQSLSNLRTVLVQLRKELADYLIVSNRTLAFNLQADFWLDTAALQNHLSADLDTLESAAQVQDGLQLYGGAFLEGLSFPDAPRFNEWAMLERERLHLSVTNQYRDLASYYLDRADYKQGIAVSDGWLALDMLDEAAHRFRMQVLALDGQRSRALTQYDQCARILQEELSVAPAPETTALFEQLRSGGSVAAEPIPSPSPTLYAMQQNPVTPVVAPVRQVATPKPVQRPRLPIRAGLIVAGIVLALLVVGTAGIFLREDAPASGAIDKVCYNSEGPTLEAGRFNGDVWLGVLEGAEKFDAEAVVRHEFPTAGSSQEEFQTAYANNLNDILNENCDLVITAGFNSTAAVAEAARTNPDVNFMMLDSTYDPPISNIWAQVHATDEGAFLAGYVAASLTQTGVVGTLGGFQVPPVEAFMDGFARGVAHYNEQKGASVEVLGWDIEERSGLFINSFWDEKDGYPATRKLIEEGADIILPVAGVAAYGAADIALQHEGVYVIGVDSDWADIFPEYADIVVTSIEKRWSLSIIAAMTALEQGEFAGGTHIGTLENGEVALAPFRAFDALIPEEVARELVQVKADIITGRAVTRPPQD